MEHSNSTNPSPHSNTLPPGTLRFTHKAMATIFEVFIIHEDPAYAEQAAWEAFKEIDQLEEDLSKFIENSDISRINSLELNQSVRVGLPAFECLLQCSALYQRTFGAFDVTIGPLMNCWLNTDKTPRNPSKEEIDLACSSVGMRHVELDPENYTVKILSDSIRIDLGGFGKGYALDQIAELFIEWDIEQALIHGGQSSVIALGPPEGKPGWPVTTSHPGKHNQLIAYIYLQNKAFSGSGLRKGQHIINPRNGYPVEEHLAAWAFSPTAAESDALSTAFMVMSLEEIHHYCDLNPETQALIIRSQEHKNDIIQCGNWGKIESNFL